MKVLQCGYVDSVPSLSEATLEHNSNVLYVHSRDTYGNSAPPRTILLEVCDCQNPR